MSEFIVHTKETAPAAAGPIMDTAKSKFGFVPNLIAMMAESPAIAEAYITLSGLAAKTGLNAVEQQVVYQSINYEAGCQYCVAAHSGISKMVNMPDAVLKALRAGKPLPDAKLNALSVFAKQARETHGHVGVEQREAFYAAGYTKQNVLDVILLLGTKVLSNATNYIAETPVDAAFEAHRWEGPEPVAAAE